LHENIRPEVTLMNPRLNYAATTALTATLLLPLAAYGLEALVVDSNGDVGIGTETPEAKLEVRDTSGTRLQVRNTGVGGSDQVMFRLEAQGNDKIRFALAGNGGASSWTFDNTPVLNEFSISRVGTGQNEFVVNAGGNGRFRGSVTATGFHTDSSRTLKTDIVALDPQAVLQQVLSLPVSEWRYKQDESTRHIGPMAEDFQAVFGLGNGQTVPLSDATGLALASVQGLHQQIAERDEIIARLEQRLAALEAQNAQLSQGLSQANAELIARLAALETRLQPQERVAQR
jgi:hypothetical protein